MVTNLHSTEKKTSSQRRSEDERITAVTGDVLLYEGDKICVFYGENTYEYSRIGRFVGLTDEELKEFFGEGAVKVTLFLDYWDY